jgi:hypothetical protein|tara:strand:- start:816 stop:1091 length:276 start_codon:yes stop_codon:yes gene_type:complete
MKEHVNVITIEKNVPIPALTWTKGDSKKYLFVDTMEIEDSFKINGNTPDFSPTTVRSYIYGRNTKGSKKFTIRTLKGNSSNPTSIRVWRTK